MSAFIDSTAGQEVRTYAVLVLVINNKSQLLLFLQAGPIMEEKLNKINVASLFKGIMFPERETQTCDSRWLGLCAPMGHEVQEYVANREGGDPSTAHVHSSP